MAHTRSLRLSGTARSEEVGGGMFMVHDSPGNLLDSPSPPRGALRDVDSGEDSPLEELEEACRTTTVNDKADNEATKLDDEDEGVEEEVEDYEDDFEDDEGSGSEQSGEDVASPTPPAARPQSTPNKLADKPEKPKWCEILWKELNIQDAIASGAVGEVRIGMWRRQQVAVKTLFGKDNSKEMLAKYQEELLLMSCLHHENIVKVFGACMTPPNCCIVMELCQWSLFEHLHRRTEGLDRRELIGWAIQIASALHYLHTQTPPICHRDVKSHNVLVSFNRTMKLCDFGLVNTPITTAGTPNYMAPELFLNQPHSKSVDVFAFALLLWEMFAREVPFDGYQPLDIKAKVVANERPALPHIMPHKAAQMVEKAWDANADHRPGFGEILDVLNDVHDRMPLGASLGVNPMEFGDALDALIK